MISSRSPTLFITYDGLLDPLGASQILPYLRGLTNAGQAFVIISFEKAFHEKALVEGLAADLRASGICWKPLMFTHRMGPLGKAWDLLKMYIWAVCLAIRNDAKIVHARGHSPAQVGLFLKRLLGLKLIFDFRGLWVDERVDKGSWDLARRSDRFQYRYFKRMEKKLLAQADHVIVLTHAVIQEVMKLGVSEQSRITVIPCCADFDHFPLVTTERRNQGRIKVGISESATVLGYLGSIGRMYMIDRFLRLFEIASAERDELFALIVTRDVEKATGIIRSSVPEALHSRISVISATRDEVPGTIAAIDVSVSFIQPSYARLAASPTKLGEFFAEGIPVICNAGVGDTVSQLDELKAGIIVDPSSDQELRTAVARLDEIIAMGGSRLRTAAHAIFGLELAVTKYQSVYFSLNEM